MVGDDQPKKREEYSGPYSALKEIREIRFKMHWASCDIIIITTRGFPQVFPQDGATPPVEVKFFWDNFFCGNFVLQKTRDSPQFRLGIALLAQFGGPIARRGANALPGPLPLGQ